MTHQHRTSLPGLSPRRSRLRLACAGLACVLLAGGATAAGAGGKSASSSLPRYGVWVYSDLCQDGHSGEMGGQRITLHRFAEADSVIYEFTAGALSWPQVAADVVLDTQTGTLSFSVLDVESQPRTLIGKFARDGAALTIEGGYCGDASVPMKLPKVNDFSRKPAACKPCPVAKNALPGGSGASQPADA